MRTLTQSVLKCLNFKVDVEEILTLIKVGTYLRKLCSYFKLFIMHKYLCIIVKSEHTNTIYRYALGTKIYNFFFAAASLST